MNRSNSAGPPRLGPGAARALSVLAASLLLGCNVYVADFDGDGVPDSLDCEPTDPSIYPGAEDLPGDGIDKNCDDCPGVGRVDGIDADCDGFLGNLPLDDPDHDCDDNEASVHPGAVDEPGGVDMNCDEPVPEPTPEPLPRSDRDLRRRGRGLRRPGARRRAGQRRRRGQDLRR